MLPPELVDTIVEKIGGMSDLKSCSLAASVFRYACQKRLLATLSLGGPDMYARAKGYDEAAARFEATPSLALLVVNLNIWLSTKPIAAPVVNALFSALVRVSSCTISGQGNTYGRPFKWKAITNGLSLAVSHWLSAVPDGTMRYFHVSNLANVPQRFLHDIFRVLGPRCFLSFTMMSVDQARSVVSPPHTPPPFHFLFSGHTNVHQLLTTPDSGFVQYSQSIRKLTALVNFDTELDAALLICAAATHSLEHLQLTLSAQRLRQRDTINEDAIPRLFSLRLLEVVCTGFDNQLEHDHSFSWFLSQVLAPMLRPGATPCLAQIQLTLAVDTLEQAVNVYVPSIRGLRKAHLLLHHLDKLLAGHNILLRFMFRTGHLQAGAAEHLEAIFNALKEKLPSQARKNLLKVVAEPS
ncbi:hypothetical protein MIND_00559700 [Mycena indigotica]|uniref:F-box domain-containing protein n=1 Tax=Mycena indigotica TaxID=2126181 RepID=A0A8H6WCR4_9AGAR|nr:uncharacterized protein MIND_00559700 [Mycena indigotica]KAF7307644.1 hypothetical protein MIND_00559700 [Mycena indigotica]